MKALPVYVYRNAAIGDCTNNGVSNRYDRLLVLSDDGYVDVDESNVPENVVKIVKRVIFGQDVYHVEPVKKAAYSGWMAGGNYVASSDSRFSKLVGGMYGAVAIHDRDERWDQYYAMSN